MIDGNPKKEQKERSNGAFVMLKILTLGEGAIGEDQEGLQAFSHLLECGLDELDL